MFIYNYDNAIGDNKHGNPLDVNNADKYKEQNKYRYQILSGFVSNFNFTYTNSAT